jgi:hypothetical protein
MSEVKQGDSGATSDKPAKSSRNPLERIIVWGVIAALLVVVYFEFRANSDYQAALKELQDKLEETENSGTVLYRSEAEEIAKKHGNPTLTAPVEKTSSIHGKHQEATYTWKSLLREQKIYVVFTVEDERLGDEEANVIAIETEQDRQEQQKAMPDEAAQEEPAAAEPDAEATPAEGDSQ